MDQITSAAMVWDIFCQERSAVIARPAEARAADDYPLQVIEVWAPLPVTEKHVERAKANSDNELRSAVVVRREVVGIGALVLKNSKLRACYVVPHAARRGVGTAIVNEIERIAPSDTACERVLT